MKGIHLWTSGALLAAGAFSGTAIAADTLGVSLGAGGTSGSGSAAGSASYFSAWAGALDSQPGHLGPYLNIVFPSHFLTNETRDQNQYSVFNAGLNYGLNPVMTAYGGLGWSHQSVQYRSGFEQSFQSNKLNLNAGMLLHFTRDFGLNVSYDSAPQGFNVGVLYKFR